MKLYIAGKITGDKEYFHKFNRMELEIKARGHIPLNPAWNPKGMSRADYMRLCFAMIDVADWVIFLKDWKDSPGARLERAYCDYIGKPYAEEGAICRRVNDLT